MIRTRIDPHDVFDAEGLRDALGLQANTLSREVRKRRLRACKRAKRYFFLGKDVLDWLRAGEVCREPAYVNIGNGAAEL